MSREGYSVTCCVKGGVQCDVLCQGSFTVRRVVSREGYSVTCCVKVGVQ